MEYELAPSMLSADFGNLSSQFAEISSAGAGGLHIDVMDGHFVPNISMGLPVIKSIRSCTKLYFDTHLMISDPLLYAERFAEAGADSITFHLEAADQPEKVIECIRKCGKKAGISIKPGTPAASLEPYIDKVDMVLLMTVEPGFGGQAYIESSTEKIAAVRKMADSRGLDTDIEVDGGIAPDTIDRVLDAGANIIVAGSAVFKGDIRSNIRFFEDAFARRGK